MRTRYGDVFVWGRVWRGGTDSGRTFPGFCEPTSLSHAHLQERGDQSESESELVSQIIGGGVGKQKCRGRACKNSRHSGVAAAVATPLPRPRLVGRGPSPSLPLSSNSDLCLVASSLSLSLLFCLSHFIGKTVRRRKTTTSLCAALFCE